MNRDRDKHTLCIDRNSTFVCRRIELVCERHYVKRMELQTYKEIAFYLWSLDGYYIRKAGLSVVQYPWAYVCMCSSKLFLSYLLLHNAHTVFGRSKAISYLHLYSSALRVLDWSLILSDKYLTKYLLEKSFGPLSITWLTSYTFFFLLLEVTYWLAIIRWQVCSERYKFAQHHSLDQELLFCILLLARTNTRN